MARPLWALEGHRAPLDAGIAVGTVVPYLHGMSAVRMHQPRVGMDVARTPGAERSHHAAQLLALVSQHVLGTCGVVRGERTRDEPALRHQLEPTREAGASNAGAERQA